MANVKVTMNLSEELVGALKDISVRAGVSMTEAMRRAISTEKFLLDERNNGGKILIEKNDGKIREIIFS